MSLSEYSSRVYCTIKIIFSRNLYLARDILASALCLYSNPRWFDTPCH